MKNLLPKILIVEDEENYRTFLKKVVGKRYTCETASSGIEAREMIKSANYDIIIHDLRLPGLSGRELIKYVRNRVDKDIINIIITGYENDWSPIDSKEEDVFFYLKKGEFKPDELLKILDNAVKIREARFKEKLNLDNLIIKEKKSFLTKLAISIAHEINNPLQSMILVTHLLKRNTKRGNPISNVSFQEEINILEKSIFRIKQTVELLIEFNRKKPSEGKYLDLETMINNTISFIRPIAKEKGITVNVTRVNGSSTTTYVMDSYIFALLYFLLEYIDLPIADLSLSALRDNSSIKIKVKSRIKNESIKEISRLEMNNKIKLSLSREIFENLGGYIYLKRIDNSYMGLIKIPFVPEKETATYAKTYKT